MRARSAGGCGRTAGVSDADATAIRAVIERQLRRLRRGRCGDGVLLASPEIRQMFSTARNFMTMVQAEYAVVYRPASTMFADVRQADGRIPSVRRDDGCGRADVARHLSRGPAGRRRLAHRRVHPHPGRRQGSRRTRPRHRPGMTFSVIA
ncbi:MAG: DUF4864 domain-containing protein [Betaproteobacteria bacterium]|nr:DUF4864 domain-containing protein [Betaproteobacteria bacterium]